MKSILSPVVLLFILNLSASAHSQPVVPDSPRYLLPLLAKSKPDTNRVALLNRLAGYYISPDMKEVVYFAIFLVILVVRPTGLFGLGRGSE